MPRGLITAERDLGNPEYRDEDLDLFAEIGRRGGIAVENARLLELERRPHPASALAPGSRQLAG